MEVGTCFFSTSFKHVIFTDSSEYESTVCKEIFHVIHRVKQVHLSSERSVWNSHTKH